MFVGHILSWEGVDLIPVIGLVVNMGKKGGEEIIRRSISWLERRNTKILIEKKAAETMGFSCYAADYDRFKNEVDIIIIFGGDGTFLHTANHFFGTNIPLLGVNLGRLGFLTEIETNQLGTALEQVISGNYSVEKRMILDVKVERNKQKKYQAYALNDVAFHRGVGSMIEIKLYINNEIINSYRADGNIVATPTGSTAYSLSAGGPIVNPRVRSILITPICPHTLYIRPMVISDQELIKINLRADHDIQLTADGRYNCDLQDGDDIYIKAADRSISIIKLPERTFYTILHEKMKMGLV